jgi:hypothetical protein
MQESATTGATPVAKRVSSVMVDPADPPSLFSIATITPKPEYSNAQLTKLFHSLKQEHSQVLIV